MRHPAHWISRPLAEVVDILDARRIPVKATDRVKLGGDVPYYGATGQAGTIDRAIFNEPLVLLGEDGAPFFDASKSKAYLVEGPAWVNNHAHVLRPRPGLDRRFLKYFLDVFDYRGFANGTTRLKLTQAAMRSIPVPIADSVEQGRIVEILEDHLSRLDSGSAELEQAHRRLVGMRASLLHQVTQGPRRLLGDVKRDADYGTSAKCSYEGRGAAVLRIPNLRGGSIDRRDMKFAVDTEVSLSASMVAAGDVLIVRTNGSRSLIGRSAVVDSSTDAAFASYLIRYRVNRDLLLPEWLHLSLESPSVREELERRAASSAGQHNLSLGKLDSLEIPVPDLGTQASGCAAMRDLDGEMWRTREAIDVATTRGLALRRAVLAAAFEGKLTGRQTDTEVIEEMADVQR